MTIKVEDFGVVENQKVNLFTLKNSNGMQIKLTNYGGIVTSISTPDKNGVFNNVVLGFDSLDDYLSEQYLKNYPYFGCIIGRVGNRIANGTFELDGKKYQLSKNNGTAQLHGGNIGFDRVVWEAAKIESENCVGVRLNYLSKDGGEGYPGNLKVTVEYTLNNQNEFGITYYAETDKATPVNLTQHSYFNLGNETTIKNHLLKLNSDTIVETDDAVLPTGNMLDITNTPFDFRKAKRIGDDINQLAHGYDHTYAINNIKDDFIKIADLIEPNSGRVMEVFTTEVSVQLYTGFWNPTIVVDGISRFGKFSGVALETQHYPDAVNHAHFPNTILRPNEKYHQKTIYKFSNKE